MEGGLPFCVCPLTEQEGIRTAVVTSPASLCSPISMQMLPQPSYLDRQSQKAEGQKQKEHLAGLGVLRCSVIPERKSRLGWRGEAKSSLPYLALGHHRKLCPLHSGKRPEHVCAAAGAGGTRSSLKKCLSAPPSPDCRPTEYGPDCSLPCQCAPSSSYCNARNGQCLCLNGYTGPTCREGNV